jgi:hypothetical protein
VPITTTLAGPRRGAAPSADAWSVTIVPATPGTWRVSTTDDSFGGLFTSQKAALAFAQAEERRTSTGDARQGIRRHAS